MRCVLTLAMLLVVSTCSAQIIVSDQLPPPVKYPPKVYTMTDAEFFKWATKYNKAQLKKWNKQKAALTEPEYIDGAETSITGDYFGGYYGRPYFGYGGYGYGGYGYGGYGGYLEQTVTFPRRWPNPRYVSPAPLTLVNPYVRPTK